MNELFESGEISLWVFAGISEGEIDGCWKEEEEEEEAEEAEVIGVNSI
jgi:hypothetical protein